MFQEFLFHYLYKASYEIIDGGKTYCGEIPSLRGVWATGKTLEECRSNLIEVLEGWVILRVRKNLSVPNFRVSFKKAPPVRAYAKT